MGIDLSELDLPPLQPPQDDLRKEMQWLLKKYSKHLRSIAQIHSISKSRDRIGVSEAELTSGTIMAKWSDHRKRREAVISMNPKVSIITFIYNSTLFNFSSDP
jgi:RNA-dependent RNA polymerase